MIKLNHNLTLSECSASSLPSNSIANALLCYVILLITELVSSKGIPSSLRRILKCRSRLEIYLGGWLILVYHSTSVVR